MVITEKTILNDFNRLKKIAKKSLCHNNLDLAFLCINKAANLMYNSNLIYEYDDLEKMIKELGARVFAGKQVSCKNDKSKKRLVFYDYFVLDNRGLSEQYLDALFDSEYEILFVGCHKSEKSTEIYNKLAKHKIKTVLIEEKNPVRRTEEIVNAISDFLPDIILAHTAPWDVEGLIAISLFEGRCKRYLINITDHAFWLGASVFDYYIEFRDYGYNISKEYRKIDESKLLKLPYYPIVNKNIQFGGFKFETEGKKIIFSGGSIYKIQGSPNFLEIVKHILTKYEDTVFLFLGNGDFSYLQRFIEENKFQNRFFYESERKDIWEVFNHCDLYLNTYPLIGGLMTQYACMAGKVPLTLKDKDDHCNDVYELMTEHFGVECQFKSVEELEAAFDEYMRNLNKIQSDGERLKSAIITPLDFSNKLLRFLNNSEHKSDFRVYEIDTKKFAENYIRRFNANKRSYYGLFLHRNLKTAKYFFGYYVRYVLARCKIAF